ncbi:MAG: tetratricopeptide repeat protein [Gammaproteobacteria bacterium]
MEIASKTRLHEANEVLLRGDYAAARDLYEALVASGSKAALLNLAVIYERGNADVPQDFAKAKYWYERALTEANAATAALQLGHYYYHGLGVSVDYDKAFSYYSRLKSSNDPIALLRLGMLYDAGKGVTQDLNLARDCYRRAARLRNIRARKNWGVLEVKHGNFLLGIFLWTWAIIQGVPLAFINTNDKRMQAF